MKIKRITKTDRKEVMYDVSVKPHHTFVANGIITHNTNFLGAMSKEQQASHVRHGHIDNAELLYAAINRRIRSRFLSRGKLPGKLFLVSSKRTLTDFTERRILEARDDPHVFVREYANWSVRDPKEFMSSKFRVLVGNDTIGSKIIDDSESMEEFKEREDVQIIEVPDDFRDDFERDLESSIRDIAGIATVAVSPFFRNREKIMACIDRSYRHPFTQEVWDMSEAGKFITEELFRVNEMGERVLIHHPEASRHVHIDPSIRNDFTGIAIGHTYGYKDIIRKQNGVLTLEKRPLIWMDLVLRVRPMYGEDIIFADIRKMIYALSEMGMPIRYVSLDTYQSFDSIQAYQSRGYEAEVISVDRPMSAYDSLKGAIYDDRLKFYYYAPLIEELKRLEYNVVKKKVDHPIDFFKDCADAVCGVVYSLSTQYVGEGSKIIFSKEEKRVSDYTGRDTSWLENEETGFQMLDDTQRFFW